MKFASILLAGAVALISAPAMAETAATTAAVLDTGNTTWLLMSAALVMLMTPGLAFFYAGMVNRKNVVSTLLQNYVSLAIVGLLWVSFGYSLVFSEGNGWIGGTSMFMLNGLANTLYPSDANVPHYAFMAFQMMFAIITPALISGAIAERVNFKSWMVLLGLWSLCVYVPVAHWVWGPQGWLAGIGGLDFAGGLVVHVTAGVAGLVAALMYGKRNSANENTTPNDVGMVMLGAALLWFGWFGFNAGSAISSGMLAAHAFVTTFVGAAAAMVTWMLYDWITDKRPTATGSAIGLVVGLVTITPAAGFVTVQSAMIMCALAGIICNMVARFVKAKTKLDDTLDVFACHGVGGALGAIMTGLFASSAINPAVSVQGYFVSGELGLLVANTLGVLAVAVFTASATFVLIKLVNAVSPIRVTGLDEDQGLDKSLHGEMSRFHDRSHMDKAA